MSEIKKKAMSFEHVGVNYKSSLNLFANKDIWALKDIDFTLYKGETLGVIGRNGAGKSTLLKLMAGIINPNIGEIKRYSHSVQLLSLQVGFMPHLSGRENAVLSGILLGMRKKDILAVMDEVIEFSELEKHIDDPVRTYSTGMRARLGFAVANQADPDVLLIDEVLGVGDSVFRKKSRQVIMNRIRSDKTVVIVSHSEETIESLCDRAILIEDGVTVREGNAEYVLENYGKI